MSVAEPVTEETLRILESGGPWPKAVRANDEVMRALGLPDEPIEGVRVLQKNLSDVDHKNNVRYDLYFRFVAMPPDQCYWTPLVESPSGEVRWPNDDDLVVWTLMERKQVVVVEWRVVRDGG